MLRADDGKSQAEICRTLKCCPATARYWINIARSGMAHQWQECSIGRPKKVNDEYLERLKELVSGSPRNYGYSFQRWTAKYLSKHLAEEFGVELTEQHINRLLKQMGLSTRQKASNSKDTNNLNVTSNRIFINDIQSENIPDSLGFLSIGLINLGKH
jgi:transposase